MRVRGFAVTAVYLFLLSWVPCAAEEPEIFEGPFSWENPGLARASEKELLFNDRNSGGFKSRSFYFTAYFDDGEHLEISVFQWEYSLFGGWGFQVVVADALGRSFVLEDRIPDRAVSVAEDRFLIRFGDSVLTGSDGRYRVRLELKQFRCDLSFDSRVPPWSPGDGYARLDSQAGAYIRYGIAAPLAEVRGSLTVSGRTRQVAGWGYADRGLIAAPINRMNSPTYAFRGFSPYRKGEPGWLVSLLRYESHPAFGPVDVPVLLLIEGDRWIIATKMLRFTATDFVESTGTSVPYPTRMEVYAEYLVPGGRVCLDGAFVGTSLYHYSDVFEKIPAVFRAIIEVFFQRPIIFRLVGAFRGTVTFPDGSTRELELVGHGEYTVVQ